jgi:hypothetical protein
VRTGISILLVSLLLPAAPPAQQPTHDHSIELDFKIDEQPLTCGQRRVELKIGERRIVPPLTEKGFQVPSIIDDLYASPQTRAIANVSVEVICDAHSFAIAGLYPAQILPGYWTVGIWHPPSWFGQYTSTQLSKTAMWLTYLTSDCYECDPGIVILVPHDEVPIAYAAALESEQIHATGVRARDIAYALSVFKIDRPRNLAQLVSQFTRCLSRPTGPDDDGCDEALFDYLANLYWRGDDTLLPLLFRAADSKNGLTSSNGYFYGDLLDQRLAAALSGLATVSPALQEAVCRTAAEDDLSIDSPKAKRVEEEVAQAEGETGSRCLRQIESVLKK